MSTTASCTFGGHNYNNGGWTWTSFNTSTGYGYPGFGIDGNGYFRVICLKITTPSIPSGASNKQIQIKIPLYRETSGSDNWKYRVYTTAPTFTQGQGGLSGSDFPSGYMASGQFSLSTSTSYSLKTITIDSENFASNTTYYIWLWAYSSVVIGYYGNSTSAGGTISASLVYDQVTYSYYAPSVSLSGYSGFYGGATLTVSNNSSYPYIYVGNSASGTYYRKATSGTSISIDADTSSTSKTIYVVRVNADAGSSFSYSGSTYTSFSVPRYACAVYNGSSSYDVYSGNSGTFTCSKSGYTFKGLATSSSTTTTTYTSGQYSSTFNGNIYYAVYTQSKSITYYRGSSTSYSASATSYLYGKGSTSSGTISEPTTRTCLSNSSYSFQGWGTVSNSISGYWYDTLDAAYNNGYTTVYGVYLNSASSTNSTVYYYRGSSSRQSVTKTTTIEAAYYYGKGSHTGGSESYSYGSITSTCAADSSASLLGWATSSSTTSYSYTSATEAFDNGYTTIYGVYQKSSTSSNSTVYYYRGTSTKNSVTKTTQVAAKYYYGTGSTSGGGTTYSYGTISSTCAADSSASLVGWTTSSSSTASSYSTASAAFDAGNSTIYGIFKKAGSSTTSNVYYYRGTSTQNSTTKTTEVSDKYYYGTGLTSGGSTTYSYGDVDTSCGVSGWTFLGFTTSSTTQSATDSAASLFESGATTIYGTYSLTETMTYYPQNGESSGSASVTNYRYGTGSVTTNRPTEPTLSKNNCTQLGWGASADDAASTWITLWDAGTRTVYAIWKQDNQIYFGVNGVWVPVSLYYGVNGEWKPSIVRYGANEWK